jgi:hypothetical protein
MPENAGLIFAKRQEIEVYIGIISATQRQIVTLVATAMEATGLPHRENLKAWNN